MSEIAWFLTWIAITLGAALGVVLNLRPHLRRILIDLCSTPERADFWAAFSNLTLILAPLVCALSSIPRPNREAPPLFELGAQLRLALIGLVVAVFMIGLVISRFIPRATHPK
jgi:hypothetical protein